MKRKRSTSPSRETTTMALPSTPDKFPSADAYDEIVDISVGKDADQKTFQIHKGLLCFYSGYFQAALSKRWKEGQEKYVDLSTEDPHTFKLFTQWVYSRRVDIPPVRGMRSNFEPICKLWVFGDAHQIPLLQNEMASLLHKQTVDSWCPPACIAVYVYENTVESAPLRRLVMDLVGKPGTLQDQFHTPARYPRDALIDLVKAIWAPDHKKQSRDEVRGWDVCAGYHVHIGDAKCAKDA